MSKEILQNPFRPSPQADPNLSALAEQGFLSEPDVAKLRKFESTPGPSTQDHGLEELNLEEGLDAAERVIARENDPKYTRERLIKWADKYKLGDEVWVDEVFEFQSDGSAICVGDLDLGGYAEIELPKGLIEVQGYLDLYSLISAEGLTLPDSIGRSLYLNCLILAEDLTFPNSIGGDLYLSSLTSAVGLILPNSIGGYLNLCNLTSAKGLTLPDSIWGGLDLNNLVSAEGLTLPRSIGGHLNLDSLISAEHLVLTDIKGTVILSCLLEQEKQELRKKYPHLRIN